MNKMQMAHEYVMQYLGNPSCENATVSTIISVAWQYADAMQAEADKREKIELSNKSIETVLNADLSQPMCLEDVSDWQPDWSQAPRWANWWVATADSNGEISGGWFYEFEPDIGDGTENSHSVYYSRGSESSLTESFGYPGNWKNSLRKRPQ